jgi:Flp pilus assembly protein TadB
MFAIGAERDQSREGGQEATTVAVLAMFLLAIGTILILVGVILVIVGAIVILAGFALIAIAAFLLIRRALRRRQ